MGKSLLSSQAWWVKISLKISTFSWKFESDELSMLISDSYSSQDFAFHKFHGFFGHEMQMELIILSSILLECNKLWRASVILEMEKLRLCVTLVDNEEQSCRIVVMGLHLIVIIVQLFHGERSIDITPNVPNGILSLHVFRKTNSNDFTAVPNPLQFLTFVALMDLSSHCL